MTSLHRLLPKLVGLALGLTLAPTGIVAAQSCPDGQYLFDHEYLEGEATCIPENPQRLIALDAQAVELALLTGRELVGAPEWVIETLAPLDARFAEALEGVEPIGYPADLEQVLRLNPDLILASDFGSIDAPSAREIAPLLVSTSDIFYDWKTGADFWSAVFSASESYQAMLENYWARVEELRAALGNDPADTRISMAALTANAIWLPMPEHVTGPVLSDVGFSRPPSQSYVGDEIVAAYGQENYIEVSDERFDLLEGDYLFYYTTAQGGENSEKKPAFIEELEANPLWQSLGVVQADHAYYVGPHWWDGQLFTAANMILDDLFTHLTDTEAQTPVLDLTR